MNGRIGARQSNRVEWLTSDTPNPTPPLPGESDTLQARERAHILGTCEATAGKSFGFSSMHELNSGRVLIT